jgi:hypothetical protein
VSAASLHGSSVFAAKHLIFFFIGSRVLYVKTVVEELCDRLEEMALDAEQLVIFIGI